MIQRLLPVVLLLSGLAAQTATFTTFGTGCITQRQSFFELFNQNTFDMAGLITNPGGFTMIQIGDGFLVLPLLTTWRAPTIAAHVVGIANDGVSEPQDLGFNLQYPGGSTSTVWLSANGYVKMRAEAVSESPLTAFLFNGRTRIAAYWTNLSTNNGTGVTFESDEALGIAWITYQGIPELGGQGNATFQIVLQSGRIDVLYGPCRTTAHSTIVGWSRGDGSIATTTLDLTQRIPFFGGPDLNPLTLGSTTRPRIGTTMTLTTTNIPAGTTAALLLLSGTQFNPGIDLTALGMKGCSEFVGLETALPMSVSGASVSVQLAIPNLPALVGQSAYTQSIAFHPLLNVGGLVTSNGATLLIGSL